MHYHCKMYSCKLSVKDLTYYTVHTINISDFKRGKTQSYEKLVLKRFKKKQLNISD